MGDYRVDVSEALESKAFKTNILSQCRGGHMVEVYALNLRGEDRIVYKVYSDAGNFLFKTTTYFTSNGFIDDKVKAEYDRSHEYEVKNGEEYIADFLKPIESARQNDNIFHKTTFETLYKYGKDTLQSKLPEMSITERINAMKKLLIPMSILERQEVIHGDLRPENVIVEGDKCLIADFGMKFEFKDQDRLCGVLDPIICKMLDEMIAYAPPEMFIGERSYPTKIDIYTWGMSLYQLVMDLTYDELKEKIKLRLHSKTYEDFLLEIRNIRLANKGVSKNLENWVKEVLLRVLDFNPQKRPTFNGIKKKASLYKLIQTAERKHYKKIIESRGNTLLVIS